MKKSNILDRENDIQIKKKIILTKKKMDKK